jgi:hypothetical protein
MPDPPPLRRERESMSEQILLSTKLSQPKPDVPGYPCAFSADRRYRYALWRHWGQTPDPRYLMVVGLNPSTADETQDDPTIRRCIGYAKAWGFDALCMTNLFAFRATDPANMKAEVDPAGPNNGEWLATLGRGAGLVLAAWGVHGTHRRQDEIAEALFWAMGVPLYALGTTKDGHPRHPLYCRKDLKPERYAPNV